MDNRSINKKILDILFDNKDRTIGKKYIVKNDDTIVDQLNLVKIEKDKQAKIDLIEIDKNVKKRVLDA